MRLPLILNDSLSLLSVHVFRASFRVESCALIYRVSAVYADSIARDEFE